MFALLRCRTPFAFVLASLAAAAQSTPVLTGFITDPGTPFDFQVNQQPVHCVPLSVQSAPHVITETHNCQQLTLGSAVTVFGRRDDSHRIEAVRVEVTHPTEQTVSGIAIIDSILTPLHADTITVRAEGYAILITPETTITLAEPFQDLTSFQTNTILRYTGTLRLDGTVLARSAELSPNTISDAEAKIKKSDTEAVETMTQNQPGKAHHHLLAAQEVQNLVPFHDQPMQDRLNRIGNSLIPRYQRDLPPTDPTRIPFRFELIDDPKLHTSMALANGAILVPRQVLERLPNDSQLATVLAGSLAVAIEKQALRSQHATQKIDAAEVAGFGAGLLIPGVGLATSIGTYSAATTLERREMEQCTRTGFAWLRDAGYDPLQAPLAWWRLDAKDPDNLARTQPPARTQYLYHLIATTRATNPPRPIPSTAASSASAHP